MGTKVGDPGASRVSSILLYVAIAGAPLPFGSVDRGIIAFWCLLLGAALVLSFPRGLTKGQLAMLAATGVIALLFGFVLHEQLAEVPWVAKPHPIWAQASAGLGTSLGSSVSIVRYEPFYALGAPLASLLALACGIVVGVNRHMALRALQVMAWSGSIYALYGIVQFALDPAMVLWREKQAYTNVLTATFINRNTAAVYFGACAIVWSLFLWQGVRAHLAAGPIEWTEARKRIFYRTPKSVLLAFSMFFLSLGAMFMTASRAGVVISLLMLVVAFVLFFRYDLPRRSRLWTAAMIAAAIALLLLQLVGGGTNSRFDTQGVSDGGRLETYKSTIQMISENPWFGTGLGTYKWAFPIYRNPTATLWGVWDRAHSTPLELAAEMGIPLTLAVAASWAAILLVLSRCLSLRSRDRLIPLAAFSLALLALLHSCVDFSLQIPGFSIVICAIVGVALAQSQGVYRRHLEQGALA
jgi:O-antigen ligase